MAEKGNAENREEEEEGARPDEHDTLAELARQNQEFEARYGGDASHGRERPMSLWERLKQAISILAATGPTR